MKKKFRFAKVAAMATAAMLTMSAMAAPALAIFDPNAPTPPTDRPMILVMPIYQKYNSLAELPIVIDGEPLRSIPPHFADDDDTLMVPLRAVAEALGFTVVYRPDLAGADIQRGNQFTTIYFGRNAYFFNRVAPFALESAPVLKNGVTFVPISFFEKILKLPVAIEDDRIAIGEQPEAAINAVAGETFEIALTENASTGYAWRYTIEPAEGLTLVDEAVAYPEDGAPGTPGVKTWTFQADAAGEYTITFAYDRSFDENEPVETRVFTVVVTEATESVAVE